jgi:hypothetical protein
MFRPNVRDFNDDEAFPIDGASRGRTVTSQPASPEEEQAYASGAWRQAGRENREYYRRTMGTPTRRPTEEQPFGPEDFERFPAHPPQHIETSQIRDMPI